ncbi:MAG: hypothetical protein LBE89_05675 [Helicobacteraceae bacterium]|nr:hypothetical protein [Helicobacteraceae bacterium]
MFVSLLIVGCGGGGGDNKNNGSEVKFKAIVAGGYHSLALSEGGKVYATGQNDVGRLGLGNYNNYNSFTKVTSLSDKSITSISAGIDHSFALSNDGKVYATGKNNNGQLGLGDYNNYNSFTEVISLADETITSIFAGEYYSFAISSEGKVYATGGNGYGQLGLGDTTGHNTFTEVTDLSNKNIIAISAGFNHSLALSEGGKVYAAGGNSFGQRGVGTSSDQSSFTEVSSLNSFVVTSIVAGAYHSLALSSGGIVGATGSNNFGQLGLGDDNDRNTFTHVSALTEASGVIGKAVTSISANYHHSLALFNGGKVYAAGWNGNGQLGLGNYNNKYNTFTEVSSLSDKNIVSISAGIGHSLALSNDGKIYAAGWNHFGELGLGNNQSRNTFTKVTVWDD